MRNCFEESFIYLHSYITAYELAQGMPLKWFIDQERQMIQEISKHHSVLMPWRPKEPGHQLLYLLCLYFVWHQCSEAYLAHESGNDQQKKMRGRLRFHGQQSTRSFLASCPKNHFLGSYRKCLVYWYLKLDNQVVNLTLGWIWRADDP